MRPTATLYMKNGSKIVIELLPDAAPNTVNSFIYAARRGFFNNHRIERVVPGSWIDMSYHAFGRREAQYLIPWEYTLKQELEPIRPEPGCVVMGGYGEDGEAGCEFFFPVRECPDLEGTYPVFGYVKEGMEEIYRIEKVETFPITDYPDPELVVNEPVEPEIVERVELELFGQEYPEPVRIKNPKLPACWFMNKNNRRFFFDEM